MLQDCFRELKVFQEDLEEDSENEEERGDGESVGEDDYTPSHPVQGYIATTSMEALKSFLSVILDKSFASESFFGTHKQA